jgi:hypothetical protein
MWRALPALIALTALTLAACGGSGPGEPATARPTTSVAEADSLYEADGTVLDDGTGGPRLCLGMVLTSLPPQCGGIPLAGWDWRTVGGEERADGTTWGSYHVVGEYDGETLAVVDVGPSDPDASAFGSNPDFSSPCPEPAGGWVVPDPARNTQNDDSAAFAYATAQPDYVASWVTQLDRAKLERSSVIVNVVVTGEAERHEAEIRKVWNGPLCVVERDVPTARELGRLRKEVEAGLGDLGLEMLWSSGPDVEPVIEIGVVADAEGKAQAALDERYGAGVVRLFPALTPVS